MDENMKGQTQKMSFFNIPISGMWSCGPSWCGFFVLSSWALIIATMAPVLLHSVDSQDETKACVEAESKCRVKNGSIEIDMPSLFFVLFKEYLYHRWLYRTRED